MAGREFPLPRAHSLRSHLYVHTNRAQRRDTSRAPLWPVPFLTPSSGRWASRESLWLLQAGGSS